GRVPILAEEVEAEIMIVAEVSPDLHRPRLRSRTDRRRDSPFCMNPVQVTCTAENSDSYFVEGRCRRWPCGNNPPVAHDFDHRSTSPSGYGEGVKGIKRPKSCVGLARHAAVFKHLGQRLTDSVHDSCVCDRPGVCSKDYVSAGVGVGTIREGLVSPGQASC